MDEEKQASVPYFVHEGIMDKMERMNVRMHSALRIVCLTLIVVTLLFVAGYTVNNRNWMRYAEHLEERSRPEVTDAGVHEQPYP